VDDNESPGEKSSCSFGAFYCGCISAFHLYVFTLSRWNVSKIIYEPCSLTGSFFRRIKTTL
jgi:hypothetical protein